MSFYLSSRHCFSKEERQAKRKWRLGDFSMLFVLQIPIHTFQQALIKRRLASACGPKINQDVKHKN
jgi:hypothetical protein